MVELKAEGTPDQRMAGVRLKVTARSWTAAELKGLPGGGSLLVEVESDGPVRLALVPASQRAALPDPAETLFSRKMQSRLVVEAALPAPGDYLLLADNRENDSARNLVLTLIGKAAAPLPAPKPETDLAGQLAELVSRLDSAFEMAGLTIVADPQAAAGLARSGNRIVLGGDCDRALVKAYGGNTEMARDALLFALLHAVAQNWLAGGRGNTVLPEQLAAALMILFNQLEAATRQAQHLASGNAQPLDLSGLDREAGDPLHPVTARSVARRLRDPQALLTAMQGPLLKRMRPATLRRLLSEQPAWANPGLVQRALDAATGGQD